MLFVLALKVLRIKQSERGVGLVAEQTFHCFSYASLLIAEEEN
jgi:hypothetical protein